MDVSSMLSASSAQPAPKRHGPGKSVAFELLLDEGSKTRARIPLRVKVNPHDTTESIISTVKNFYGIYDGNGVSFADAKGDTLIASYDNLAHGDTVYVRSVAGAPAAPASQAGLAACQYGVAVAGAHDAARGAPSLAEPFHMLPPHLREQSHSPSRASSRLARKRSASPPQLRGRRSVSQQKGPVGSSSAYATLSRGSSASRSYHENEAALSDSDAGRSSLSGSRKAKSEQIVSSDISTANVLQDGRRGQTIFDSSTLPLFVPPQVPVAASQSSISPQRRSQAAQDGPSPFRPPAQKLFGLHQAPVLSPVSQDRAAHGAGAEQTSAQTLASPAAAPPPHGHHLRDRHGSQAAGSYRGRSAATYAGHTVLPTPDPTVASCISDEDVARTLIALGDASNYSHGRTSTSTMDDTFSGLADAASSTGATSDSDEYSDHEGGLPRHRKFLDPADQDYGVGVDADANIKHEEYEEMQGPKTKKIKTKMYDGPGTMHRKSAAAAATAATAAAAGPNARALKPLKSRSHSVSKSAKGHAAAANGSNGAAAGQPRKPSSAATTSTSTTPSLASLNFQHQLAADEEDLSTKPRCQRCRKSKKGCDRQRPCQRCKDAGIGIEGCISEDEGNGRKGRFGRHMGVPVKKAMEAAHKDKDVVLPAAAAVAAAAKQKQDEGMMPPPISAAAAASTAAPTSGTIAATGLGLASPDKGKKRKR